MECPAASINPTSIPSTGEFQWSPELQGYILSSGYLGYALTQIPGGILAKYYGSKKLLVGGLLVAAAANLLSPLAARESPYILIALTLIRGFAQGMKQPALSVLMSKWFPKNERGFLCCFIYSGYPVGAFITGIAGGKLCELKFLGGWPLIFYVFGILSAILALFFLIFYHNIPEEDPRVLKDELKHIQNSLGNSACSDRSPTPWLRILSSPSTHILVLALFGQNWMNFYFVSVHTIYVGTILHLPIKQNGILSATPFVLQAVAGWVTCYFCFRNKTFRINTLRKGVNSFSCLVYSLGVLGVYFAKCSILLNEIFSHLAMLAIGFGFGGSLITAVDLSPTFCGPLMGFANTIASLAGFLAPVAAGHLTNEVQNLTQWGKIFFIAIGVCLGCGLGFQLLGSAEVQPYDPVSHKPTDESQTENEAEKPESSKF